MARIVFTMIGNSNSFAFRFGERQGDWWNFLSINNVEFRRQLIDYSEVKNERLKKVYVNFCRRMNMKGQE